MHRYFFHIRDGQFLVTDEEGMECRSLQAVQEEANATARDMMNAAMRSRSINPAASVEIEDEQGNAVRGIIPVLWIN